MTQPETRRRCKLSAIVVSYNREEIIGTVLRGLQFADEVILLDKSFTDRTAEIGAAFVDRVVRVPWSPTVEETRVSMESYCTPQDSPHSLFADYLDRTSRDSSRCGLLLPTACAAGTPKVGNADSLAEIGNAEMVAEHSTISH